MKDKIVPVVSVVIGILAFFLTSHYLRNKHEELKRIEEELYAGARKVWVVAAANTIPRGAVIKRSDIGKLAIFEAQAPDKVIPLEDAALIVGRRAEFEIKAMKPVLWSDIVGGVPVDMGLAPTIKPGMRAISMSLSSANTVSSMVQPNDRVDILGTFPLPSPTVAGEMETVTLTMLQDVTILATGQMLAKDMTRARGGRRASYSSVTVEVTPREAELLVFAQQAKGQLTLALRNPSDLSFEKDIPEINFKHLESQLPELNLFRQRNIRHKKDL